MSGVEYNGITEQTTHKLHTTPHTQIEEAEVLIRKITLLFCFSIRKFVLVINICPVPGITETPKKTKRL